LLSELHRYIVGIVSMQNHRSNMVYVVSLGPGSPQWATTTWIDFVEKHHCYFHPFAPNWPKEPPNYLGLRYRGQLQSVHHIDEWQIVDSLDGLPGVRPGDNVQGQHFLYRLGPPIRPPRPVLNGKSITRAVRAWAMLDLLLTSQTISEAAQKTKARLQQDD
jgi:hypothetical protein